MFKAISSAGTPYPRKDFVDSAYHYRYLINDDEFNEIWTATYGQRLHHTEVRCGAIISCYVSKGLNVAFNLALYHKFMVDNFSWYKLEDEFGYNCQWTPFYSNYVEDVKKYLDRYNKLKAFW